MATQSDAPRDKLSHLIPLLTILVLASFAAMVVMLARINTSNTAFRAEVEKEILIGEMGAAVQLESQIFGTWTAAADGSMDLSSMDVTAGSEDMAATDQTMDDDFTDTSPVDAMPASSGNAEMTTEDAGNASQTMATSEVDGLSGLLAAPHERFSSAAEALYELQPADEQAMLDQAISAHALLIGSGAELDRLHVNDGAVMATYHGSTQLLEADLRATLEALRIESSERVAASISEAAGAEQAIRVLCRQP